jgi:hypothetical protein
MVTKGRRQLQKNICGYQKHGHFECPLRTVAEQ